MRTVILIAALQAAERRAMAHSKPYLPTKVCPVCHRPFAWRKKWARDWEQVKFCSERCRRAARGVHEEPKR